MSKSAIGHNPDSRSDAAEISEWRSERVAARCPESCGMRCRGYDVVLNVQYQPEPPTATHSSQAADLGC